MADITQINVNGTDYNIKDTTSGYSTVSVTQVVSSGTNIADITVDGTTTHLYASGGSSVSPYTSNPAMNGTASAGSSNDYARGDHVHPKDTSKQDTLVSGTSIKTINNTSVLGSGDIAVQPTLVSGTNIKTINNESLLGSGNITIQGGGGVNVLTCYTNDSFENLWYDQSRTESLLEHYGYDLHDCYDALMGATLVNVINTAENEKLLVVDIFGDFVDDTLNVVVFKHSYNVSNSFKNIGLS